MGQGVTQFWCNNSCWEYNNITFWLVLTAHGTTYQSCPPDAHRQNGVAERIIHTISEKARSMMIDSQALHVLWVKAVNQAVYLRQRTPNVGLTTSDDHNHYEALYPTPYQMLHAYGKPSCNNDGNKISYQPPHHHLGGFTYSVCRLCSKLQRHRRFSPRSKRNM